MPEPTPFPLPDDAPPIPQQDPIPQLDPIPQGDPAPQLDPQPLADPQPGADGNPLWGPVGVGVGLGAAGASMWRGKRTTPAQNAPQAPAKPTRTTKFQRPWSGTQTGSSRVPSARPNVPIHVVPRQPPARTPPPAKKPPIIPGVGFPELPLFAEAIRRAGDRLNLPGAGRGEAL